MSLHILQAFEKQGSRHHKKTKHLRPKLKHKFRCQFLGEWCLF